MHSMPCACGVTQLLRCRADNGPVLFTQIADLLWPRRCGACDRALPPSAALAPEAEAAAGLLCRPCAAAVVLLSGACPRCAAPLSPVYRGAPCPDCRRLRPVFSQVVALYEYGGAMAQVLYRLKWQGRDDLAGPIGRLLGPRLRAMDADLLLPVPLHPHRLRSRGYNQASLLLQAARRTARVAPPVRHDLLYRRREAPPTRGAGAWRRLQQAAGAFYVPDAAAPALRGRRVLLCDDVVTTGATVQSCASALLGGGAAAVSVLCLCRAAP